MKILMVSAECAPLIKSGGLGDAVSGLAAAFAEWGHEVRIALPLYSRIDREKFNIRPLQSSCVHMGQGEENWVGVHKARLPTGVDLRLIAYDRYFARPGVYDEGGTSYSDNGWRFALFCKAALQTCKDEAWIPDIVHGHDWSSALCGLYLKTWDRWNSPLSGVKTLFTIHNIGYQGKCPPALLNYIGVGFEHFSPDGMEDFGAVNLLKTGINYSEVVTTVSPTHAQELLTPDGGHGLAPYLQNHANRGTLRGILNGVDDHEWNPAEDRLIADRYTVDDLIGKRLNKKALQLELGLPAEANTPLIGCVTRLTSQKGTALLREALPRALHDMRFQFVLLGSGEFSDEDFFRQLQAQFPGRVASWIGFKNDLAHHIYAGSDYFLMPSIYEPCGLGQLYAMRYGAVPIVRATGGLADTVEQYDEQNATGTGMLFQAATAQALYDTIGWAVSTWFDRPSHYLQLQRNAMKQRFPWSDSAENYLSLFPSASGLNAS